MRHTSYLLLLTFYIASCTEDYHLSTMDHVRILTIDGCITDEEGPYLVRLTENITGDTIAMVSPVMDARVVITDDAGNMDELNPLWKERVAIRMVTGGINTWLRYYLLLPRYDGGYDSLFLSNYEPDVSLYEGLYYTRSIKGIPGRTYTLTVNHHERSYTATDRMAYPATLDSVVMRPVGFAGEGKGEGYNIPHLYFPEPQDQENYYLFSCSVTMSDMESPPPYRMLCHKYGYGGLGGSVNWRIVVTDDRFMSPYMVDYKIGDGPTASIFYSATDVGWQIGPDKGFMHIYMVSLSKPVYQYLQALTQQFYQDGGAFSPAPCSPPSNVSNGGQGVFMATSVTVCRSGYYSNR